MERPRCWPSPQAAQVVDGFDLQCPRDASGHRGNAPISANSRLLVYHQSLLGAAIPENSTCDIVFETAEDLGFELAQSGAPAGIVQSRLLAALQTMTTR